MSFPVFDLHCDTALALYDKTNDPHYSLRSSIGHIDLQRAKELGAYTQCFAMFTTPSFTDSYHGVSGDAAEFPEGTGTMQGSDPACRIFP